MVSTTNNKLAREIDKLNEYESSAVVEYISRLLSQRLSKQFDAPTNDDLIQSLSDRRENQRARQVVEWERTRRRSVLKAA